MHDSPDSSVSPSKDAGAPATGTTVFKIGDLAREFGVTLRTLRFYEDRGLINPGRSGTTRLYGTQDRERLRIALFCKRIGMSLGEIRHVLELSEAESDSPDVQSKLHDIYVAQLRKLQQQHTDIEQAISELNSKIAQIANS